MQIFYLNLPPDMPWTLLASNFFKYQKSFWRTRRSIIVLFLYIMIMVNMVNCQVDFNDDDEESENVYKAKTNDYNNVNIVNDPYMQKNKVSNGAFKFNLIFYLEKNFFLIISIYRN